MAALAKGLNVVVQQKVGTTNKPIYPFTKFANVINATGDNLATVIDAINAKNFVPDFSDETTSSLRFLRNDNTWATIQDASTTQKGVVQLYDGVDSTSTTAAATAGAVKTVNDAVEALEDACETTYVKLSQLGVATVEGGAVGVATLGTDGLIPSSQLPSYVDDIVEGYMYEGQMYKDAGHTQLITPEASKIYVTLDTNLTYRWSGTKYVEISASLALGETENTAYRGDRGKIAYDHSQATHARVDATKVEASTTNGNIKIDGDEVTVYTHPTGDTATNPHGTTKADVGLGDVDNKSEETIIADTLDEIDEAFIVEKLGYTPQNAATLATATNNGVMSAAYAAKLDGCLEIKVDATEPTFVSGSGIWIQVISEDA